MKHKGTESVERADAITSPTPERGDAARLPEIWRGCWGIENQVHWVGDEVFGEDRSHVRTGPAPQLMAALPNLALNMPRLRETRNLPAAVRHYGWNPAGSHERP